MDRPLLDKEDPMPSEPATTPLNADDIETQLPNDDYLNEDPNRFALLLGTYLKKTVSLAGASLVYSAFIGIGAVNLSTKDNTDITSQLTSYASIAGGILGFTNLFIIYHSPYDTFKALQKTVTALKSLARSFHETNKQLTNNIQSLGAEREKFSKENVELSRNVKQLKLSVEQSAKMTAQLQLAIAGTNQRILDFLKHLEQDQIDSIDERKKALSQFLTIITDMLTITERNEELVEKNTRLADQLETTSKTLITVVKKMQDKKFTDTLRKLVRVLDDLGDGNDKQPGIRTLLEEGKPIPGNQRDALLSIFNKINSVIEEHDQMLLEGEQEAATANKIVAAVPSLRA